MQELDWDIGLAPMPDTPFHACKHYNKWIEYSSFGIAGVYSDVLPYKGVIRDGVDGLLCENTAAAWTEAIARLIDDAALCNRIAEHGYAQANGRFSLETTSQALSDNLGNILQFSANTHWPIRVHTASHLRNFYARLIRAVKKHGIYTPIAALKKIILVGNPLKKEQ